MKYVKYILLALILLIAVALVAAWFYLEPLVKSVVNKYGTQAVGTEVTLGGFKLHPLSGTVEITDLKVANPEGYTTPCLFGLGSLKVKVDPKSLLTDTIVVENIAISAPKITYEMTDFSTNNIMQLQKNMAKNADTTEVKTESPAEESKDAKEQKNVIIHKVLVEGGALTAITPLQKDDTALTLPLPAIEIAEIGGKNQKVTLKESIVTIFNKILFNAASVVTKVLGSSEDIAKKAVEMGIDKASEAAGKGKGILQSLKFW